MPISIRIGIKMEIRIWIRIAIKALPIHYTVFFPIARSMIRSGALTSVPIPGYRRAGPLTENGDLAEESLVHLPLPDGGAHQDPAVAVPVNTPQLQVKKGWDLRHITPTQC